jgi:hypothetical protein
MIQCPNCKHEEFEGALFCSACGAQLSSATLIPPVTQNIQRMPTEQLLGAPPSGPLVPPPVSSLDAPVALYAMDLGQIIPLADRTEFTLGRSSEGQTVLPDIDLSPYQAYDKGVSRLHAAIKLTEEQVLLTDLGSVNGTRLNGQRMSSNKPTQLHHGDIIALGKLKLQVIIRR